MVQNLVRNGCVTRRLKIWKQVSVKCIFNVQSLQDIMATERMQHGEVEYL